MLEHERITIEPCGCHTDQRTGISTVLCAEHTCDKCGGEKDYRVDCWNCGGEGTDGHDCGEDCCCCLHPEDNVRCDICDGKGGWLVCLTCYEGDID